MSYLELALIPNLEFLHNWAVHSSRCDAEVYARL
jgi:hypothetical protein